MLCFNLFLASRFEPSLFPPCVSCECGAYLYFRFQKPVLDRSDAQWLRSDRTFRYSTFGGGRSGLDPAAQPNSGPGLCFVPSHPRLVFPVRRPSLLSQAIKKVPIAGQFRQNPFHFATRSLSLVRGTLYPTSG